MVRSFERRIESLFLVVDPFLKQEVMNMLDFNLRDNVNSYVMKEDGSYEPKLVIDGETPFNIHKEFYNINPDVIERVQLIK